MLDLACALRISGMDLVHQTRQRLALHRHRNFALAVLIGRVIPAQSFDGIQNGLQRLFAQCARMMLAIQKLPSARWAMPSASRPGAGLPSTVSTSAEAPAAARSEAPTPPAPSAPAAAAQSAHAAHAPYTPPSSSAWVKRAVNSVNLPASVDSMFQRPILLLPAATSPNGISRVFCTGASST